MSRRVYLSLWVTFSIAVLGGLYWVLKYSLAPHATSSMATSTFHLNVSAPPAGEEFPVFKVMQGDTVTLIVHSDQSGELHVHASTEQKIVLNPHSEVKLTFVAAEAGLFPVHLHDPDGAMRHLAMLEVQPR